MKIAINTRLLQEGKLEGIGQFTAEIFKRLCQKHPEVEWIFVFDRPYDESFRFEPSIKMATLFPPTRHAVLWHWWFQFSLKRFLKKEKVDLYISPDGFIPLGSTTPSLAIIHDLNFVHQPSNLPKIAGAYMRHYFPKYAQQAIRIGTVSKFCRQDIAQTYDQELSKIDLIYNGVNPNFHPSPAEIQEEVRSKYSKGQDFFVFVGALNPRKNVEGMLAGYQQYRQSGGQAHFVMVGEAMLMTQSMKLAYDHHPYKEDIHWAGRLSTKDLGPLISSAQALLLCSHFEGFGIPILEAFSCETALICANNTAMPEIAGEAALFCEANDAQSIAAAMLRSEDAETRESLTHLGRERLKNFSWDRSAEMMWSSIQKCLESGQS